MRRTAKAVWKGSGQDGKGALTTQSGVLTDQPYSFKMRFENEDGKQGTNSEELIAAAHSGCFVMAFSVMLGEHDITPDELICDEEIYLEKQGGGFAITRAHLKLEAKIPGIDEKQFQELAAAAKDGCPVSGVLNCEITLDAKLK